MKIAAIDLETLPDMDMVHQLPDPEPNKTLKDTVKIEDDIRKKREKQIDDMGMNPLMNIVCCAGIHFVDTEKGTTSSTGIMLENESRLARINLLEDFWASVHDVEHFVTFNGRAFDTRVLYVQNMRLGVRPSVQISTGKYNKGNHTDIRLVLNGDDPFAKGNLDFFANIFLDDHKTEGIDGKLVNDYWQIGAYDKIREYCLKDCELTYRLFDMALNAGLVTI